MIVHTPSHPSIQAHLSTPSVRPYIETSTLLNFFTLLSVAAYVQRHRWYNPNRCHLISQSRHQIMIGRTHPPPPAYAGGGRSREEEVAVVIHKRLRRRSPLAPPYPKPVGVGSSRRTRGGRDAGTTDGAGLTGWLAYSKKAPATTPTTPAAVPAINPVGTAPESVVDEESSSEESESESESAELLAAATWIP